VSVSLVLLRSIQTAYDCNRGLSTRAKPGLLHRTGKTWTLDARNLVNVSFQNRLRGNKMKWLFILLQVIDL
jgi:hypothetical protein